MIKNKQPDWEMDRSHRDEWEALLSDLLFGMCAKANGEEMHEITFIDTPSKERAAVRQYDEKYETIEQVHKELVHRRRDEDSNIER